MNNGKVAVVSAHHALLLHGGLLAQCDFSITRPPPVGDRVVELYKQVRLGQDGLISAGITLPATINANSIPDEYSDIYFIRPKTEIGLDSMVNGQIHRPPSTAMAWTCQLHAL